jgi:AP-3 complex subunit mu
VINDTVVSFNLSLSSRLPAKSLQNVVVELNLGEGASGIKCITSREAGGPRRGMDAPVSSAASWAFDSRKKVRSFRILMIIYLIYIPGLEVGNCRGVALE